MRDLTARTLEYEIYCVCEKYNKFPCEFNAMPYDMRVKMIAFNRLRADERPLYEEAAKHGHS